MKSDVHPTLRIGAIAILVLVAVVEVTPYLWMIATSLMTWTETTAIPPTWWPDTPQWTNFQEVWTSAPFLDYVLNSVFIATAIAIIQALLSCLAGYAFARLSFPGRDALFYVILACLIIPAQVRFVSIWLLLDQFELINTYTAQILPHAASALGIFLMRQAYLAVPQETIDAAKIDGAGTFRIIFQVLMPTVGPTLIAFLLFSFVYHWNDYFWPLVVTLDESVRPLPLGVAMLREQGTGSRWHLIMAGNVILVAPLLIAFILAQKHIVRAFTLTSAK